MRIWGLAGAGKASSIAEWGFMALGTLMGLRGLLGCSFKEKCGLCSHVGQNETACKSGTEFCLCMVHA